MCLKLHTHTHSHKQHCIQWVFSQTDYFQISCCMWHPVSYIHFWVKHEIVINCTAFQHRGQHHCNIQLCWAADLIVSLIVCVISSVPGLCVHTWHFLQCAVLREMMLHHFNAPPNPLSGKYFGLINSSSLRHKPHVHKLQWCSIHPRSRRSLCDMLILEAMSTCFFFMQTPHGTGLYLTCWLVSLFHRRELFCHGQTRSTHAILHHL